VRPSQSSQLASYLQTPRACGFLSTRKSRCCGGFRRLYEILISRTFEPPRFQMPF
jgi:hypothetical protein